MKTCLICSASCADDAAFCSSCGEASFAPVEPDAVPSDEMPPTAPEPGAALAEEPVADPNDAPAEDDAAPATGSDMTPPPAAWDGRRRRRSPS